jgi:lactate dehydrogenase-like 2-hydroxyacid dehydrogenase
MSHWVRGYRTRNLPLEKAFGMRISVITKHPARLQEEQLDTDFAGDFSSLDEMLSRVKYVVLALPLTDSSRGLFDQSRFVTMQPASYLINVSRGTIVQEGALYADLETGRLAGAAIDVSETVETDQCNGYPSLFPFHQYNVIMTPIPVRLKNLGRGLSERSALI